MPTHPSILLLKNSSTYDFIHQNDIIYLSADGPYTKVVMKDNKSMTICKKLKEVLAALSNDYFFRIHNSYVVNLYEIIRCKNQNENTVELSNGDKLPIARSRKQDFLGLFRCI